MIFLALSIICNVLLIFSFRFIKNLNINTFQVIVVNYITCYILGMILSGKSFSDMPFNYEWFYYSLILGALFISVFYILGLTAQKYGAGTASIANKLSLVIPVSAAFYLYNDSINIFKISGIILALIALYLSSKKAKNEGSISFNWLPVLVFIGSGLIDTLINYTQKKYVGEDSGYFAAILFGSAGLLGVIVFIVSLLLKKQVPRWKSLPAGIIVGLINYGSLFFLLKTLDNKNWESSAIFPINNIGIVTLSVIGGALIFHEKVSRINIYGIIMAIFAIILIAFF